MCEFMIRREGRNFPRGIGIGPQWGITHSSPPLLLEIWGEMLILFLMFCDVFVMDVLREFGVEGCMYTSRRQVLSQRMG